MALYLSKTVVGGKLLALLLPFSLLLSLAYSATTVTFIAATCFAHSLGLEGVVGSGIYSVVIGGEERKLCVQIPNPKWNTFPTGKGLLPKAGHLLSSFELLGL